MTSTWEQHFGHRFDALASVAPQPEGTIPLSIKVRVTTGCFHREHSPKAYEIIEDALRQTDLAADNAVFEEHESGPEVLLWLAVAAGSLNLATSIINLVTAAIRARSDGLKKGDDRDGPLEVIIRGVQTDDQYIERQVLYIESQTSIDGAEIHDTLDQAISEMFGDAEDSK